MKHIYIILILFVSGLTAQVDTITDPTIFADCCRTAAELAAVNDTTTVDPVECENITETIIICTEDYPYDWNGTSITSDGSYPVTLQDANGCDYTNTLTANSYTTTNTSEELNSCAYPYAWNGLSVTGEGTYTVTLQDTNGCDYVAILVDTEGEGTDTSESITSCSYPYIWNGLSIPSSGTYNATLQDANGCDYTATLVDIEGAGTDVSETIASCTDDYNYTWNGESITAAGTYTVELTDVQGCDYTATLTALTHAVTPDTNEAINTCTEDYPYTWMGQTINLAGSYATNQTDSNGCNYVANLTATTYPITANGTRSIDVCTDDFPYSWQGQSIAAAGSTTVTLQDSNTCDFDSTLVITSVDCNTCNLSASISRVNVSCSNAIGSMTVNTTGGTSPLSYSWSNSAIGNASSFTTCDFPTGSYSVTVTDSQGCTDNASSTISSSTSTGCIEGLVLLESLTGGTPNCQMDLWYASCTGSPQTVPPFYTDPDLADIGANGLTVQLWKLDECDNSWSMDQSVSTSSNFFAACHVFHGCTSAGAQCGNHNGQWQFCNVECGTYFLRAVTPANSSSYTNTTCSTPSGTPEIYDFDNTGANNANAGYTGSVNQTTNTFTFNGSGTLQDYSIGFGWN